MEIKRRKCFDFFAHPERCCLHPQPHHVNLGGGDAGIVHGLNQLSLHFLPLSQHERLCVLGASLKSLALEFLCGPKSIHSSLQGREKLATSTPSLVLLRCQVSSDGLRSGHGTQTGKLHTCDVKLWSGNLRCIGLMVHTRDTCHKKESHSQ